MSLIRLRNVSKQYESKQVLRGIHFKLDDGDRVGLLGKNGSGKTTILNLILGRETPTDGLVEVERGVRIGYFSQFSELDGTAGIRQVLEDLFGAVRAIERELEEIAQALETSVDPDAMEGLLERQATLFEAMDAADGWEYARRIDTVLTKLGFDELHRALPIDKLSGGWRNRASLAKILLEEPNVLLLDEPTNYLDMSGVLWLESWLRNFRGAILVVSHDRNFLDGIVNHVVEAENYQLQEYEGGYTDYVREKRFRLKSLERQFVYEEEMLILESDAVADREEAKRDPGEAVRRKFADIRKRLEPRPVDVIVTSLYRGLRTPETLMHVEDLAKSYGESPLFEELAFSLGSDERLAIVGPNGSGKSTLLRLLTGEEKPGHGRVLWEGGVTFADFNVIQRELDPKVTVVDTVAASAHGMTFAPPRKQVEKFLDLLRFPESDLRQKIGSLSGGQRARVALAKCLLSGAAVLILDEPTNHLDLSSVQVMERALIHFPGAVVFVSHDRFFIDKVATRILAFEPGGNVTAVNGNWTTWQTITQSAASESK